MPEAKPKLYVGCSLTHAPEDFKSSISVLKNKLAERFEILEFIGLEKGTATDVYHWDVGNCVGSCDFFLAICDFPSLGLGYELGTAVERLHKPVLAVAHTDTHITRLVVGIDAPGFTFARYDKLDDVVNMVLTHAEDVLG